LNEIDNRDVGGNERPYGLSEEIRQVAERDRNRRRARGSGVTYSDPLVTHVIDSKPPATGPKREEYRSRGPQKGVYDHPFYRKKRAQSETGIHPTDREKINDTGQERRKSLRPTSTRSHQPTELPSASLAGQSLEKYRRKKSAKRRSTSSTRKKDDTGFMLIGGTYANSL
ncbi:hypothetical protein PMAYCL1PPCAC_06051, partial [Pristionchus mayeri]